MNPFKYIENYFFEETPTWLDRSWFYGFTLFTSWLCVMTFILSK